MSDIAVYQSENSIPHPVFRRLRGYAFDPILSLQLDTALVNEAVFKVSWEKNLTPGPVGEYLEIVDYDPASKSFYEPVNLNNPHILAQDGLSPSEGNPQFHQQMIYAVAMTTIKNFEKALGRTALWASYREENIPTANGKFKVKIHNDYIRRLRIYPHALRQANAYYSCEKKALLFGYFPATAKASGNQVPGGMVFTCLSHDIIAHETTHALLDGMHRRFIESTHPDSLAFHEAFADIVALFQHFTFPEVVRHQISQTRGDLTSENLLGALAHQFGRAIGPYGALRNYIGTKPDPLDYQEKVKEPHDRGAILVAAIFDAFLAIYRSRIADLLRIATNGTGLLQPGAIHPDLVNRLANEAAKTAQQVLTMCIRALDYCPPVDINFGDYLRAIITADTDLVPDDPLGYRIALIDAFRRRGIYPRDIRTLSVESLSWKKYGKKDSEQPKVLTKIAGQLRTFVHQLGYLDEVPQNIFDKYKIFFNQLVSKNLENPIQEDIDKYWKEEMSEREKIFVLTRTASFALHDELADYKRIHSGSPDSKEILDFEKTTGLYFLESLRKKQAVKGIEVSGGKYTFEVHSVRGARRVAPGGNILNQVIISITQKRNVPLDENNSKPTFKFRGGCTLILDLQDLSLRYAIVKKIGDEVDETGKFVAGNERLKRQREYLNDDKMSLRATYFGKSQQNDLDEPLALLHNSF
jgi:hypothetical protein